MDKNLSNFFAERGFKYKSNTAKQSPSVISFDEDARILGKREDNKFSSEGSIRDFKEAYQELKLELVKLYMDVKVRLNNHYSIISK